MRIKGSGTGNGSGSFQSGSGRSDSFRRKHSLGQKIQGTLLKLLDNKMAWVEIDGDRLIAQLEVPHAEGTRLTFIIKQLVPEIILKELILGASGAAGSLNFVAAFDAARTLFESEFRKLSPLRKKHLTKHDFLLLLASSRSLFTRYADACECMAKLSSRLTEGSKFLYQPWFAPECQRQASLSRQTTKSGLQEHLIEFEHKDMGLVRCHFLHKENNTACRVQLQHIRHSKLLGKYLASRTYPGLAIEPNLLGVTKLTPSAHGGIVTETLFKSKM